MAGELLVLRYPTRGARKVIDRQLQRLPRGYRAALEEVTNLYKQELTDATPEGKTKKLKRGWRVRRVGAGGVARNTIYNLQGRRLGDILKGTRAHTIRSRHKIRSGPRKGQPGYLKFEGEGGTVFAREVHHPGTAPNPFHRAAIRRARTRSTGIMRKAVVEALKI
jgi:hypothetical protein